MQATYIWNKFALHRSKIVFILVLALAPSLSHAQLFRWARQHNPNYDDKRVSYGFVIGLHTSAYQVKYSNKFVTKAQDTIQSVIPSFTVGFSLGFLVNLKINEFLDLRLMPKAGFYEHHLTYYYTTPTPLPQQQNVQTTVVEFPLLLKYKSMRRGNVRMYMLGGMTPGIEASGKNDAQSSTASIGINRTNLSLDAGMGFDFYFPFFKFSQEIRFSRGIVNMLGSQSTPFSAPLSRLNTNTIAVYFIFQ